MNGAQKQKTRLKDLSADDFLTIVECASDEQLDGLLKAIENGKTDSKSSFRLVGDDPLPFNKRTPLSIIAWWEIRRPAYNLIVGLCGLVTLMAVAVLNNATPLYLLFGAITYGITANLCYTLGWIIELMAHSYDRKRAVNVGPRLFKLGTTLSVLVTVSLAVTLPLILFVCSPW